MSLVESTCSIAIRTDYKRWNKNRKPKSGIEKKQRSNRSVVVSSWTATKSHPRFIWESRLIHQTTPFPFNHIWKGGELSNQSPAPIFRLSYCLVGKTIWSKAGGRVLEVNSLLRFGKPSNIQTTDRQN